jgi:hypothetical protein
MVQLHDNLAFADSESLRIIALNNDAYFVFGLQWTPLVGGRPLQVGRERARLLHATHYLIGPEPGAVLGYGKLVNATRQRKPSLHSAAMRYAHTHAGGSVACVMPHNEHGFWVVAAHEGTVLVQSDKWFSSAEQAQELLALLAQRFPTLSVCWLPAFDASEPPEWLRARPEAFSRLTRLSKRVTHRIMLWVAASAALLGALLLMTPESKNNAVAPIPDAPARWRDVMQRIADMYPIHTSVHIARVMEDWRLAPIYVGGWRLKQIQCEPKILDWRCIARYQREHRMALNRTLEGSAPKAWVFQPFDLDHALLTWTVRHAATPLDMAVAHTRADWMSYLQQVSPVFELVQIGVATRLAITAPLDVQGAPIDRPEFMPLWQKRSVVIKGPMRSVAALSGLSAPLHWRNLSLSVDGMSGSGVARSQLVVQFIGDLFEIIP